MRADAPHSGRLLPARGPRLPRRGVRRRARRERPRGRRALRRRPARRRVQLHRGLAARVLRRQPPRRPDGPDRGALRHPRPERRRRGPRRAHEPPRQRRAARARPVRGDASRFRRDHVPQRRRAPAACVARPRDAGDARRRSCTWHVGDRAGLGRARRGPADADRVVAGGVGAGARRRRLRGGARVRLRSGDAALRRRARHERRCLPGRQRRPAGRRVRAGRRDLQRPRVRPVAGDLHPARRAGDRVVAGVGGGAEGRGLVGGAARLRQHPVVQDVRRLGPKRFQISGYVTNATPTTRVHVQRRVGHHWVMVRRAEKLSADGRFRVVVRAPRWPRLRVMVVGSGGSRPAARR